MSRPWIFQANPDVFDIDAHLAASTGDFRFLVTRHKNDIAIGDTVYIWRAIGKQGDGGLALCAVNRGVLLFSQFQMRNAACFLVCSRLMTLRS